ncbi:MAG: hypothetical protein ABI593_13750 [Betaproteobacteria bacterium]
MQRVPPGDTAAWARERATTADPIAAIGDACAAAGHVVSAHDAWLRAANYCRASYMFLYGNPVPPALVAAFARESATCAKAAAACAPALRPVETPNENTTLSNCFCPGGPVRVRCWHARTARTRPCTRCISRSPWPHAHAAITACCSTLRARGRALFRQQVVMRHDWELVVRPVIDFAQALPRTSSPR